MSVLGIDFGNSSVVLAQPGRGGRGIDVVLNENSHRQTPTMVSFMERRRFIGAAAEPLARSNFKNTVTNLKRLMGRKYSEPSTRRELDLLPFETVPLDGDRVGVVVRYEDQRVAFTPERLLAMLLSKLRWCAERESALKVADVVVSVPVYFTDEERRAVLHACTIAGINCIRLLNDTTAAALDYGIYKSAKGLFSESDPQRVMFINMGHSGYAVSIVAFLQGKLKVLTTTWDRDLGGRDFDVAIAQRLAQQFQERSRKDAWTPAKSRVKLLALAEKLRKDMTPYGVNQALGNVECLVDEADFAASLTLEEMEQLCEPLLARLYEPVDRALHQAGLTPDQLASVEVFGGAMRMRMVKQRLAAHLRLAQSAEPPNFGLSTTLNMDECVARGCAMQCAILSPLYRVKEFQIVDAVPYPVCLTWEPEEGAAGAAASGAGMEVDEAGEGATASAGENSVVVFRADDETPKTRRVNLRRSRAFEVTAAYDDAARALLPPGADTLLGHFSVMGVPELPGGEAVDIRLNAKHDAHGCFTVSSAQFLKEKPEESPVEPPAKKPAPEPASANDGSAPAAQEGAPAAESAAPAASPPAADAAGAGEKKRKKMVRADLIVKARLPGMSDAELGQAVEEEARMARQDRIMEETANKRNELEAYMYALRDKLAGELSAFATDAEKQAYTSKYEEMEDWLYSEEADNATKAVLAGKLGELQAIGNPVQQRLTESQERPAASSALLAATERFKMLVNTSADLAHLTDEERNTVRQECQDAERWISDMMDAQAPKPLTAEPVLRASDIRTRLAAVESRCRPIVNKPKPKPKVEKKEEKAEGKQGEAGAGAGAGAGAAEPAAEAGANDGAEADAQQQQEQQAEGAEEKPMELD